MVTGKSGYVDFTSTIFTVRVYWEETYDATTAKSVVSITDVQFKISDSNYALTWYPGGTCSVDGSVVCTMDYNNPATHMVSGLSSGAFVSIGTINSGKALPWASGSIAHDADGKKSVTISLDLKMYSSSWQTSWGSYPTITGSATIELTEIQSGLVYIGNVAYQPYIGNGTSWERCAPYIGNGSGWDACS